MKAATITKIALERLGDESRSQEDLLRIVVVVENRSAAKKLQFEGWHRISPFRDRNLATLNDNHGNSYKRCNFGFGTKVVGQFESE